MFVGMGADKKKVLKFFDHLSLFCSFFRNVCEDGDKIVTSPVTVSIFANKIGTVFLEKI